MSPYHTPYFKFYSIKRVVYSEKQCFTCLYTRSAEYGLIFVTHEGVAIDSPQPLLIIVERMFDNLEECARRE